MTLTVGVAAPNAVPDTARSWGLNPVSDGGSWVTGAAPWSSENATVKSTVPPCGATAVAGELTVGLGAVGGAPPLGVAHNSFTSTVRLPPPVFEAGYSKVIEKWVMWVKSRFPPSLTRHSELVH